MRMKVAGFAAAVISAIIPLVSYGTGKLVDSLGTTDFPSWLPQLESTGWTANIYLYTSDAIIFLLAVPLIALLGYRVGLSLQVSETFSRIVGVFAAGGGAGFIAGVAVVWLRLPTWEIFLIYGGKAVATGIQFGLVGLAGAALAEFGVGYSSHQQPTDSSTLQVEEHSD